MNAARNSAVTRESHPEDEPLQDGISPLIGLTMLVARVALRSLTRVTVDGAIEQIPKTGPLILAANHLSNADGVLVGGWLTQAMGRRIHWLGKREMVEWPILGRLVLGNSIHPVDRGTADVEAFRLARRILDEGHVLMVFPEGTRSPTGGLQEAKDGLAILALKTGAPILPVGISGTDRFWPRGRRPHPGGRIGMRVGEAFTLPPDITQTPDRRTAKAAATRLVMGRIAELLPSRHRGAYGRPMG
jgi:1-acyl-sn-glycerol-3-phosphate acyltransferase